MVFTIQKERASANPESPPRTHPRTNIFEVRTPSLTVFTQEHNELFVQLFFQYYQENEGDELRYHVLVLNKYSIEDKMKNPTVTWIVNFNLTKMSIHNFLM